MVRFLRGFSLQFHHAYRAEETEDEMVKFDEGLI